MTKEEFKELIIEKIKELKLDYEDFIGYTFSDNPAVWMNNLKKVLPDTYIYSELKKDTARMELVRNTYVSLACAYDELEEK